jgi:hypothetical protein
VVGEQRLKEGYNRGLLGAKLKENSLFSLTILLIYSPINLIRVIAEFFALPVFPNKHLAGVSN